MRYKVTLMYDGSSYFGWQIQPDHITLQKKLMDALFIVNKKHTEIVASGRTDTGVHAYAQVFHFDSDLDLSGSIWVKALNGNLPEDIRITRVEKVSDDFHARYDATSKVYHYKLNTKVHDVFTSRYIYQYNKVLHVEKLQKAAQLFIGQHDFSSFNATPLSVIEDQVRTITKFNIKEEKGLVTFEIEGSGFLRHMVRMLVASTIAYSQQKLSQEAIIDALNHPDKTKINYNVPGCGLYLMNVYY